MIVLGLISGTSVDAIDVACADFSWRERILVMRPLGFREFPWSAETRARLIALLPPAGTTIGEVCALDVRVGEAFGQAAARGNELLAGGRAELVASHGQTVFHWVEQGLARGTLQLGQPACIVEAVGLPVISDFRARDVAAGGQGAPLASTLDALWLSDLSGARHAALNLGGIANVTIVGAPGDPVLAFDTGPASCLLDAAASRITGGKQHADTDGRIALAGRVRPDLLERLLADPYYQEPPPKSTGRERFHAAYAEAAMAGLPPVADADLMATLTELTATTVADACKAQDAVEVVASGGGTRNPALMAALARRLVPVPVVSSDARGLPADGKEAYLFALLGFLTWNGIPGVAAGATGSAVPRVLGRISPGNDPPLLPPPHEPPLGLTIKS